MLRRSALTALLRSLRSGKGSVESAEVNLAQRWDQHRHYRDSRGYEHFTRRGSTLKFLQSGRRGTSLAIVGAGGVLIWYSNREEVPYTHRKHCILVSGARELATGLHLFEQVKSGARRDGTLLPATHPASQLVRRVGLRIVEQTADNFGGGAHSHMQGLEWEFIVIRDEQVNAFVVPGGKVVVFTGLLELVQNEPQLASVLAHEIAHVLARHTAEKMTEALTWVIFYNALALVFGMPLPIDVVSGIFFAKNSRQLETEADDIGLRLAARACYDPSAFITIMQKLGDEESKAGIHTPQFLRTHPLSDVRIEHMRAQLPAAKQIYQEAGCGGMQSFLSGF